MRFVPRLAHGCLFTRGFSRLASFACARLAARTISRCDTVKHTAQSLTDTTCVGRFLFALLWHAASCKYKSSVLEREGRITEWIMSPNCSFYRSRSNRVTLPEIYATPDLPRCVVELIFLIDNACHRVSSRSSCCNQSFGAKMLRDRSRFLRLSRVFHVNGKDEFSLTFPFFCNEFYHIIYNSSRDRNILRWRWINIDDNSLRKIFEQLRKNVANSSIWWIYMSLEIIFLEHVLNSET